MKLFRFFTVLVIGALFALPVNHVAAAPSGANLIVACEQALANDFQGVEGQMCTWYVTPCDCTYGKKSRMPRVCLPLSVPVEELAREVITTLQAEPALQSEEAGLAAALILARTYPCTN